MPLEGLGDISAPRPVSLQECPSGRPLRRVIVRSARRRKARSKSENDCPALLRRASFLKIYIAEYLDDF